MRKSAKKNAQPPSIKLTNTVTAVSSGKVVVAHNEMYSILSALQSGNPYAAYVELYMPSGRITLPTTLTDHNYCPEVGELFAAYTVTVDDTVVDSQPIFSIGLKPSATAAVVNYVGFADPVIKSSGEEVVFRAEVRLSISGAFFTDGENALAAVLLGASGMDSSAFSLAGGDNPLAAVLPRNTVSLSEIQPCTPVFNSGGITFSGTLIRAPREVVLLYGGDSVLRALPEYPVSFRSASFKTRLNSSIEVGEVLEVLDVRGGEQYDFYLGSTASRVSADCPDLVRQRVPTGSVPIASPCGKYLGVIANRSVTVFSVNPSGAQIIYVAAYNGGSVDLCSDGDLVIADGKLRIINASGERVVDGYAADKAVALSEKSKKHIALTAGSDFFRIVQDGETTQEIAHIPNIGADFIFDRHDARHIDYLSPSRGLFGSVSLSGSADNTAERLRLAYTDSARSVQSKHGRWLTVITHATLARSLINIESGSEYPLANGETALGVGNYAFVFGDNKGRLVGWRGTDLAASELESDTEIPAFESATECGKFIMYSSGERIKTLYPVESGTIVYAEGVLGGSSVVVDALIGNPPLAAAAVTLALTF